MDTTRPVNPLRGLSPEAADALHRAHAADLDVPPQSAMAFPDEDLTDYTGIRPHLVGNLREEFRLLGDDPSESSLREYRLSLDTARSTSAMLDAHYASAVSAPLPVSAPGGIPPVPPASGSGSGSPHHRTPHTPHSGTHHNTSCLQDTDTPALPMAGKRVARTSPIAPPDSGDTLSVLTPQEGGGGIAESAPVAPLRNVGGAVPAGENKNSARGEGGAAARCACSPWENCFCEPRCEAGSTCAPQATCRAGYESAPSEAATSEGTTWTDTPDGILRDDRRAGITARLDGRYTYHLPELNERGTVDTLAQAKAVADQRLAEGAFTGSTRTLQQQLADARDVYEDAMIEARALGEAGDFGEAMAREEAAVAEYLAETRALVEALRGQHRGLNNLATNYTTNFRRSSSPDSRRDISRRHLRSLQRQLAGLAETFLPSHGPADVAALLTA